VTKWSAIEIPEVVGVEHQQVLQLAKDNAESWADKARNERQMTNGLGDLFTEPNVMAWSIGSKEQILKQVQAKLKSDGVYADAVDGEYASQVRGRRLSLPDKQRLPGHRQAGQGHPGRARHQPHRRTGPGSRRLPLQRQLW